MCGDKVCAGNSGDVVREPLYAIAQSAPFSLDIGCRASKRLRVENIALANFFGKPCDMRSKTMREQLIVVVHCHRLTLRFGDQIIVKKSRSTTYYRRCGNKSVLAGRD